jgi:murein L,D-transpeptidase YcbB/YkuD
MLFRSLFLLFAWFCLLLSAEGGMLSDEIRNRTEQIRSGSSLTVEGETVSSVIVLPALYERRDFAPLWTEPMAIDQLFTAIDSIGTDGLDSRDYHPAVLNVLRQRLTDSAQNTPSLTADYDILLTDSLIRLGYHLLAGKVDPEKLDANWNMSQSIGDLDTILEMADAIETARVLQLLEQLRPQHPVYANLKDVLARYRAIQQQGGWKSVPNGPTLKRGDSDPRITDVRRRLAVSGELDESALPSKYFDDTLEQAVKAFQINHGLDPDSAVGPATLAAMNVPVEDRIDQIRVNLERARWVLHNLPEKFVLVDIAGFDVRLMRDGQTSWNTRAQVGRPFRKTPVFRDRISYLEVNPTWTVPPGILRKDILPSIRKDPDYLNRMDMQVLTVNGDPVDAAAIDWSLYPGNRFPYMIRQRPGPNNALGRIKFMFPNKHAVYLHDTPSRDLFGRSARAFSSGCIRVQHPFDFAVLLLDDPDWTVQRLEEIVANRKTTRVSLSNPVTVILLYWTVNTPDDETVIFKKDIYERDSAVLKGLKQPFRFRKNLILE